MTRALCIAIVVSCLGLSACEDSTSPPPPPCDAACQDSIAVRAVREMLKLVYNLTLQGKPVGEHDHSIACPLGGTARIFGRATSNPVQGATEVRLTYVLDNCVYLQRDEEARENYSLTVSATFTQEGTIAVQPSWSTALSMKSNSVTMTGTVHAPPLEYRANACVAEWMQNGNTLSGRFCQREVGVGL